jgi:hypothetical protein
MFSTLPLVLGAIGYLSAGVLLTVTDEGSWSEQLAYVFRNPKVVVWVTLVAIQFGACAALLPALVTSLRDYSLPSGKAKQQLVSAVVVALLLFGVLLFGHRIIDAHLELPVHHQKIKVPIVTSAVFLLFLSSLYGMCSVALAAEGHLDSSYPIATRVLRFLRLNRALQWYLSVAGLVVGGATLTTGALQTAIASLNKDVSAILRSPCYTDCLDQLLLLYTTSRFMLQCSPPERNCAMRCSR